MLLKYCAVVVTVFVGIAAGSESFAPEQVARYMAASVRLKVIDDRGHGWATGTIIAGTGAHTLVVTCGHVFRESQGQGRIEVDVFGQESKRGLPGRLLGYDVERDVALVAVEIPGGYTAVPIAPEGHVARQGESVMSVGCDHGAAPSPRVSTLNGLNKFAGPPNLQVAGQPVQGRSGGGLFSADGYLIGVCNAADPEDNEGLFSAVANVHKQLSRSGIKLAYRDVPPLATGSPEPRIVPVVITSHTMPTAEPAPGRPWTPRWLEPGAAGMR